MNALTIMRKIWKHPFHKNFPLLGIFKFIYWQISSRINKVQIHQLSENSKIYVQKGMTGITGCIYNGLQEFEDMLFMMHFMRPGELFVDAGANVGAYSILASAEVKAKTISIEPVSKTMSIFKKNVSLNNLNSEVDMISCGLGASSIEMYFSTQLDPENHILTDWELTYVEEKEKVEIKTLDEILINLNPVLLKIDVEGFELEVVSGAKNTLLNKSLKAVIIELNGSGARYGFNQDLIHFELLKNDFSCFKYDPFTRKLTSTQSYGQFNTIYIRDKIFVQNRVTNARKIKIGKKSI